MAMVGKGLAGLVLALGCTAGAAWSETHGLRESLGVQARIEQGGEALPLTVEAGTMELVEPQFVTVGSDPFDIVIPPMDCPPGAGGVSIRVYDEADFDAVAEGVLAALDLYRPLAVMPVLFPPGFGMAAEEPQVELMFFPGAGPGFEQEFNYFWDGRFFARDDAGDTIRVERVMGDGRNVLGKGEPFVMLMAQERCDLMDTQMLIDLFAVNFGG
jgi:hypothetical protein